MKTPEELIFAAIEELKEEIKYCDKSIDIRIVNRTLKKIVKALKDQWKLSDSSKWKRK